MKTPTALLAPILILLVALKSTFPPSLYIPVPPLPTVIIPVFKTFLPKIPTELSPRLTVPVFVISSPACVRIPTLGFDEVNGFVKVTVPVFIISVPFVIIP